MLPICSRPRGSSGGQTAGRGRVGCKGRGNHLLMGNTLLSIVQIALSTTAERGGRRPGGDWRPEARHDLKTGALPRHGS